MVRLSEVSAKSEVAGVKQTIDAIGESECVLTFGAREMSAGRRRQFSSWNAESAIHAKCFREFFRRKRQRSNCTPTRCSPRPREVRCDGLQVETAAQGESGRASGDWLASELRPRNCEKVWRNHGDAIMTSAALNRPASVSLADRKPRRSKINVGPFFNAHL